MSQEPKNDNTFNRTWRPQDPYNDLPKLPPQNELETKPILRQAIRSRAALSELKKATELIPNSAMLINTLPLLEAQASSEIENIVTTADQLFRHFQAPEQDNPSIREALRYREALLEGLRDLETRPLCTRSAEAICSRIKDMTMTIRKIPGTKIANAISGEVIYTPPDGEQRLRDLLTNWEQFMHRRSELDPLIVMAVAHYQFEAIHPFLDGNGRTGRVLNSLFLVDQKLLGLPTLYLSRYIITHKEAYYGLLLEVTRRGSWEKWILYMLQAVEETSRWTTERIDSIRELLEHTSAYVRERAPKIYSWELMEVIFSQPYCRIRNLVEAEIVGRQAASRYLKALSSIGVLEEQQSGREKLFVHPKLLGLLTGHKSTFTPYTAAEEQKPYL
ncbi:MAG: Fic family protein [Candidatus Eisenbacteria bacterium]|uniref:Fic family protein n=1 Tax=Eiseniibacteriota bacterium TaxID=2212470 RepID=A0A7Y2E974_UNCEI|nr:Fic family protein [Candidatus Eisenbacteria bacterium]